MSTRKSGHKPENFIRANAGQAAVEALLVLMILGALLTVTVVGAIVGIPLIIFGFLLILRGIF